jgi:uncharacterized membrane protein
VLCFYSIRLKHELVELFCENSFCYKVYTKVKVFLMLWIFHLDLFWVILESLAIWVLARWLRCSMSTQQRTPSSPLVPPSGPFSMEILRERYAHGEIDTATFEEMREELEVR